MRRRVDAGLGGVLGEARHSLRSSNRNARSAVVFGRLLGLAFVICFATGLYSHFLQDPLPWMRFPTHPAQLYQFTQGLHITAGIAIIPLLFAKLNTVMPSLLKYPPVTGVLHLLERASIAVFVSGALVQVFTGLVNTYQWYPWPFPFRQTHYALSFVLIGSLAIHIGVKLRIIVRYWRARDSYDSEGRFVPDATVGSELLPDGEAVAPLPQHLPGRRFVGRIERWIDGADTRAGAGVPGPSPEKQAASVAPAPRDPAARERLARRGFFASVGTAVAGVIVLTGGQSFGLLRPFNVFAPRLRGLGPNSLPVNRSAKAAGVLETAVDPDWGLTLAGKGIRKSFSRADLRAMGLVQVDLPISCVEGWSQMATWRGIRMRDLVALVGAPPDSKLKVTSLEKHGGYRIMEMGPEYTQDPTTLVALELNGADLDIEHGFPARVIAPGRPGVLQTKWISSIEVIA
ncbi:molybdopterin-dependent oxidoreductase [Frondihabitans australicus]|uniref:DMSO/TMAO reductase YedYZ molybdopterin-dependent catalytic subunit n=1 Tax=Frondihabitans australicus TaxID=386892 RepID=A0A495IE93_9MICO|nr:molybdopterin-dependent oxidoreductase [Frondihabitans australicus]RKR73316.1 DMSO/TMAO reductase YedYZ molybdopterin-dependent catalytic subunit [Frondihabitans australicus]